MIDFKVHLENDIVSLVQTQENHFEGLYTVGMNPLYGNNTKIKIDVN